MICTKVGFYAITAKVWADSREQFPELNSDPVHHPECDIVLGQSLLRRDGCPENTSEIMWVTLIGGSQRDSNLKSKDRLIIIRSGVQVRPPFVRGVPWFVLNHVGL